MVLPTTPREGPPSSMAARSTLVSEIQQLLTGEHADPRAAQGMFLIPVLLEFVLHLMSPQGFDRYSLYGALVVLVPSVASVAIAKGLVSDRWTIWLPVLDIVALGAFRLSDGTTIGAAVAFPASWSR